MALSVIKQTLLLTSNKFHHIRLYRLLSLTACNSNVKSKLVRLGQATIIVFCKSHVIIFVHEGKWSYESYVV